MEQKKLIIFMPSIEFGGVEKNLFIISNYLSEKLQKVSLITISKKHKNKFHSKIKIICLKNNTWDSTPKRIKFFVCLCLLFAEILKNRNVTVLCFQGNIYCTLLCKLLKIKIIVRSNSSPSGWSQNFIKKILYKKILNLADKIIVNSLEFKKELKTKFNLNATCIYNPLNTKKVKELSKIKIKNNFFKRNFINIINIGRFTEQKDHLTLLRSINLLKNKIKIKLLIIGGGVNKSKILRYIKLKKLSRIVKVKNFTNNPYPFIKAADLFVLTSRFEGLPNVLLEAITLNKFIISSNCPTGPKEILTNNKGGLLFRVGDYVALSKKILFFVNNIKVCNKKILYAKSKLYRFDSEVNLNNYLKLVKRTLTI
jgi:glycosyltransferase involved in cell wall biosynthesis